MNALQKHLSKAGKASWSELSDTDRKARASAASRARWATHQVQCEDCFQWFKSIRAMRGHSCKKVEEILK